jgi:citrate synthase
MGFPTEFFPVLFAIPRMAGWLAHWKESLDDPDTKIMRPQQVSVIKKILSSIVTMSMNLM